MKLLLGKVGVEGSVAFWDPSIRPHALITGETGQGKSFLARRIVEEAITAGAEVHVADPKGACDFVGLKLATHAGGPWAAVDLLDSIADEVGTRMQELRERENKNCDDCPILCVVDELAAVQLRKRGEESKAARDRKEQIQASLGEIALMGRAARIHLVVLMQRPDVDSIPGIVRDQLGLRIALGWMSSDGYRMALGSADLQPPRTLTPGTGWISDMTGTLMDPGRSSSQRLLTFVRRRSSGGFDEGLCTQGWFIVDVCR
jgi:hypothetical protein